MADEKKLKQDKIYEIETINYIFSDKGILTFPTNKFNDYDAELKMEDSEGIIEYKRRTYWYITLVEDFNGMIMLDKQKYDKLIKYINKDFIYYVNETADGYIHIYDLKETFYYITKKYSSRSTRGDTTKTNKSVVMFDINDAKYTIKK